MKKLLLAAAILCGFVVAAHAATDNAVVVSSCGTPPTTYTAGQPFPMTQDTTGKSCVNVSVTVAPSTSGGLSWYNVEPAASDNHANIKNGAGQVYHISVSNNSGTVNYLRLYNAASGFNGCGSATNFVYAMVIPANTSGAGYVEDISSGVTFSTGISICVTGGYGHTDTTNATATAMEVNVGYK